ncbi:hypothetical protein KOI40_17045 [Aestuariicella sp. G3-2]|uniref:hypothetical protein n=1 Tax=Pseudomaricurvus albidus TaxID=2842452 RepID=UPI001C0BAE5A|nr:hypothetical protein [Aestuariicella albida]MBU3071536.1 hypothetical protein [Aestuariicella albida]
MSKKYRLIWFHHFHKAGGSSIVSAAQNHGEVFYPWHENGNPVDSSGNLIELWDFDEKKLHEFVGECQQRGVTFVATEWGAPMFTVLQKDPRVTLVACVRNPVERMVSNFKYDYLNGYASHSDIRNYVNSGKAVRSTRYYSNMLAQNSNSQEMDEFDLVVVLERNMGSLFEYFGWDEQGEVSNKTDFGVWKSVKYFLKLRWNLIYRRYWRYLEVSSQDVRWLTGELLDEQKVYEKIVKRWCD